MKILFFLLFLSSVLYGQSSTPLLTIGSNSLQFTFTGATTVTFPASGTLYGTAALITVPQGGTGVATLALNGVLYGNAATSVLALAVNSTATNKFLTQSSSNAPAWAALVSGDIPNNAANTTGSAATLTTSRNINSVAFNGSADITVTAAAGTLTGTVLNSTVVTSSLTSLAASCAMTTPVITGLATGSGVASASTASTLVARDANANISTDNFLAGYTTTVTAAGTLTLDVSSNWAQYLTGTTTHTVKLPVANTLVLGQSFNIVNNSTGLVTVQSSGTQTVLILDANTSAIVTCTTISGTDQTSWTYDYLGEVITSGKSLSVSNRLTLAGTDGTTMTFPGTSATIARTDAANTFTGVQTMTSPALTTPVLGTPTSGNLLNCTWGSTSGLMNSNAGAVTFNTSAAGAIPYATSATAYTANSADLTYTTSAGVLDRISDAATNTVVDVATITHNSSGVIAANFGTGILLNGQSTTTADRNIAEMQGTWSTPTDASRVGQIVYRAANNTALGTIATMTPTAFNIPTGSAYQINATSVLSNNTLGSGVTASSLTSFGTSPTIVTPSITTGFTIGGTAATGTILRGNGTNFVATTNTFPNTANAGDILTATGANVIGVVAATATARKALLSQANATSIWSTETYAAPSANAGSALVGDGTNYTAQPTGWISTKVAGSDFTRTAQTLADITGLTFTAVASTTYEIEAYLDVTSSSTAGVQFAVASSGGAPTVMWVGDAGAGSASTFTVVTTGVSGSGTAGTAMITTSSSEAMVHIVGIVKSGTGSPTISIQGLKTTSGTLTVKIGSKLMYRVQ